MRRLVVQLLLCTAAGGCLRVLEPTVGGDRSAPSPSRDAVAQEKPATQDGRADGKARPDGLRLDQQARLYATWNPSDKQGNLVLSGDLLTVTDPGGTSNDTVRATISHDSERWYWEVRVTALQSVSSLPFYNEVGFATATLGLENRPSDDFRGGCAYRLSGTIHCAAPPETRTGTPYKVNDVVGIALDLGAGRVHFSLNGVWQGGTDPATLDSGVEVKRTSSERLFPAANLSKNDGFRASFGATAFSHPVPAGYRAGFWQ